MQKLVRTLVRLVLGRRLPIVEGTLELEGPERPLTIRRDAWGVPYIEAESDDDAWFGLGFCHGQDRAGQLEVALRMVRGTLSEVAGPDTLPLDRLSRRLGCWHAGKAQLAVMDDDLQRQLAAFARGVNAGMTRGLPRPAHEHALLRCAPTPWEAVDVQAYTVLICFALASNWDIELLRLKLLQEDGPEALHALDARYPDWLPLTAPPYAGHDDAVDLLAHDIQAFTHAMGLVGGSNAWAVNARKSAGGRPVLAADPHLIPAIPTQWYLCHVSTPAWTACGGSFAGVPTITIGHNGHAAWGVTSAQIDTADLFVEEVGPDGRSVREGDRFVPCEVRREVIAVKGRPDVVEEVLVTPRGPVIGPVLDGHRDAISLSATWLQPRPNRALLSVHTARTPEAFRRVFREASATNAGLVYATVDDHVGVLFAADTPKRKKGYGNLPLPGWDLEAGWEDDIVDPDAMPHVLDPPEGFVATANNQPTKVGDPEAPFLGVDWLDGYRLATIRDALEARDDWDRRAFMALQLDTTARPWREIRDAVLALPTPTPALSEAHHLLSRWDGRMAPDSPAATVYELLLMEMVQRVVRAKAPHAAETALGRGATELLPYNLIITRRVGHVVRLIREQPDGWLPSPWPEELAAALEAVVHRLRRRFGPDPRGWAWARVRPLTLEHPFGDKAPLAKLFNVGPVRCGGDATTIPQATVPALDPTANPAGVPTMRFAVELGDWDGARFVLLGGQSGNPLSPHYDDQVPLWERGDAIPVWFSRERATAAARATLEILPAAR